MDKVYQMVMLSDPAVDDERFRAIIDEAIESDEIESFPSYANETKKSIDRRIANAKKQAKEAEAHAKEIGAHDKLKGGKNKGSTASSKSSLTALIQQRQKSRGDDFIAGLEAKYGAPKKGKKRATSPDEPPEEAFERTAKRKTKKTKA